MCLLEGGTTNKNKTPLFILSIIYYNYNFKVHPYSVKISRQHPMYTLQQSQLYWQSIRTSATPLLLVDRLVSYFRLSVFSFLLFGLGVRSRTLVLFLFYSLSFYFSIFIFLQTVYIFVYTFTLLLYYFTILKLYLK